MTLPDSILIVALVAPIVFGLVGEAILTRRETRGYRALHRAKNRRCAACAQLVDDDGKNDREGARR